MASSSSVFRPCSPVGGSGIGDCVAAGGICCVGGKRLKREASESRGESLELPPISAPTPSVPLPSLPPPVAVVIESALQPSFGSPDPLVLVPPPPMLLARDPCWPNFARTPSTSLVEACPSPCWSRVRETRRDGWDRGFLLESRYPIGGGSRVVA